MDLPEEEVDWSEVMRDKLMADCKEAGLVVTDPTNDEILVTFTDAVKAIDSLDSQAVICRGPDGNVTGILLRHPNPSREAHHAMVSICEIEDGRELVRTDIRNFTEIEVL